MTAKKRFCPLDIGPVEGWECAIDMPTVRWELKQKWQAIWRRQRPGPRAIAVEEFVRMPIFEGRVLPRTHPLSRVLSKLDDISLRASGPKSAVIEEADDDRDLARLLDALRAWDSTGDKVWALRMGGWKPRKTN